MVGRGLLGSTTLFLAALMVSGCGDDGDGSSDGEGSGSESDSAESAPATGGSSDSGSGTTGASSAGSDSASTTESTTTDSASASDSDSDTAGSSSTGGGSNLGEQIELRIENFQIPTNETYYACFEFSFQLDQLGHITRFRPFIDNGAYVHHYVLTQVDQPSGNPPGFSCFSLDGDTLWAWAPGQTDFILPDEAGFLVGNAPDGRVHLRLQVHYNNPQNNSGQVDNSGFDMWVTTDLRPNSAGTLTVADVVGGTPIPPGDPAYEHITTCSSGFTQTVFDQPITVFGSMLHAHDIGSVLWTEVWRDGQLAYELNREDPFDFNFQTIREVDAVIEPGDEIVNHCIYDSTSRNQPTSFGPGTTDEMCWNSLTYYPKIASGVDFCSTGN